MKCIVGGSEELSNDPDQNLEETTDAKNVSGASYDDHLTPAERRYIEQREKLDINRLAKISNKSHRDRIEEFNQYLANMSEHYDIPKVGPGWLNQIPAYIICISLVCDVHMFLHVFLVVWFVLLVRLKKCWSSFIWCNTLV